MKSNIIKILFITCLILGISGCSSVNSNEKITLDSGLNPNDIVIDSSKYSIEYNYAISDGFFIIRKRNSDSKDKKDYAFMDLQGNILNNAFYKSCTPFRENLANVSFFDNGYTKESFINTKGEIVIDKVLGKDIVLLSSPIFINGMTKLAFLENDQAQFVLIDKKANIVEAPKIDGEVFISNAYYDCGKFVRCSRKEYENNKKLRFYLEHKLENLPVLPSIPENDYEIVFVLDRLAAIRDKEFVLLDSQGKVLKNFSKEYGNIDFEHLNNLYKNEDLAINFTNKNSIIVDYDGNLLTETNYQNLGKVSNGYVSFEKDGKFGLLNIKGELILAPEYDAISNVYENHVLLKKGDKTYIHQLLTSAKK